MGLVYGYCAEICVGKFSYLLCCITKNYNIQKLVDEFLDFLYSF